MSPNLSPEESLQLLQAEKKAKLVLRLTYLGIAVFLGICVLNTVRGMIVGSRFHKGEEAYEAKDCTTAVSYFDRVIEAGTSDFLTSRSQAFKAECALLTPVLAAQAGDDIPAGVIAAHDYLKDYDSSVHADSIRQQSSEKVSATVPEALIIPEVCDRLDGIVTTELFPASSDLTPAVGYGCGQHYMAAKEYGKAIASYQLIQRQYPDHELMPDLVAGLADATVEQAKASGAGTLPQPGRSGSAPAGSTVVVIHNASPEPMRIAFSGTESRIETLEPCVGCQVYIDDAPDSCPIFGPVGVYTLDPGLYNVVVSSSNDFTVAPFIGRWDLRNGSEYSNCFFTVQSSPSS